MIFGLGSAPGFGLRLNLASLWARSNDQDSSGRGYAQIT